DADMAEVKTHRSAGPRRRRRSRPAPGRSTRQPAGRAWARLGAVSRGGLLVNPGEPLVNPPGNGGVTTLTCAASCACDKVVNVVNPFAGGSPCGAGPGLPSTSPSGEHGGVAEKVHQVHHGAPSAVPDST